MSVIDLVHQVGATLGLWHGGTGNRRGWATGVVEPHVNWSTSDPLPLGTLVRLRNGSEVEPTDTDSEVTALGIVVGYFAGMRTDQLFERDCPAGAVAAVMTKGLCQALIADDVVYGDYAFADTDAGLAKSDPTMDAGAWGVWITNGLVAITDRAWVEVFGSTVRGAGGGGGSSFTDSAVEATFVLPTGGMEVHTRVPWDGEITGWVMTGDGTGSAEVDVWVDSYANYPPAVGDTITAAALPTISAAVKASGSPTGWSTTVTKGQWMVFHINSVSGLQRLVLDLAIDRSS